MSTDIIDLQHVVRMSQQVARGRDCDLRALVHEQARHADLVPLSTLAWWILSTDVPLEGRALLLPEGVTKIRHLVRSGILGAAHQRGMEFVADDGETVKDQIDLVRIDSDQPRLGFHNQDVPIGDDVVDRIRAVHDLTDPRHYPPQPSHVGLRYLWLTKLGIANAQLADYFRFLSAADEILFELIENVHKWSLSTRGLAIVSVTRGSCNRLHVVIMDDGCGIPGSLATDPAALEAVSELAEVDGVEGLIATLLRDAFGDRDLPGHHGQGLNVAAIRASQWVGAVDIVTSSWGGGAVHVGSRGLDETVESHGGLDLPEVSGTLVHVLLQATDAREHRETAAHAEQLPMPALDAVGI